MFRPSATSWSACRTCLPVAIMMSAAVSSMQCLCGVSRKCRRNSQADNFTCTCIATGTAAPLHGKISTLQSQCVWTVHLLKACGRGLSC